MSIYKYIFFRLLFFSPVFLVGGTSAVNTPVHGRTGHVARVFGHVGSQSGFGFLVYRHFSPTSRSSKFEVRSSKYEVRGSKL